MRHNGIILSAVGILALSLFFITRGQMAVTSQGGPSIVFVPVVQRQLPTPTPTPSPTPTATATLTPTPTITPTATPEGGGIVYITGSGTKYHDPDCRYVQGKATPVSCAWAKAEGYGPCSVCDPYCP